MYLENMLAQLTNPIKVTLSFIYLKYAKAATKSMCSYLPLEKLTFEILTSLKNSSIKDFQLEYRSSQRTYSDKTLNKFKILFFL